MKKILLFIILSFSFLFNIEAKEIVTLNKCVDGDTAWFNLNGEKIKTRFLAIDTPESTNKIEKFGKEASEYTCNMLKNAKKIEIEYDENSNKLDKYERHLVWVFVDGKLLQNLIIQEGLGKVDYLYGDYKYTKDLQASELIAKNNNVGMWEDSNNELYIIGITLILVIILICCFNKKIRNKVIKKTKSKLKKEAKKYLKKL